MGVSLVALGEPDYPLRLQMIDDAPPLIAVRGQSSRAGAVAGRDRRRAQCLGGRRQVRGADRARTWARPASASSRASPAASMPPRIAQASPPARIAVLAGGHDRIYPPEHVGLAEAIVADGALISEMPLGLGAAGARLSRAATG